MSQPDDHAALFARLEPSLSHLRRVALVKAVEEAASASFVTSPHILGLPEGRPRAQAISAALHSSFQGVADFSADFYRLLETAALKQRLTRALLKLAMAPGREHGFHPFEAALVRHACDIATAYDGYYFVWSRAVQGNEVARRLAEVKPDPTKDHDLLSGYTIIQLDARGQYYAVPYATFFKAELAPVLAAFDAAVAELRAVLAQDGSSGAGQQEHARYVGYLEHYRRCLAEEDVQRLEPLWEELDRLWMDIRHPIQLVHDIESGYGDPLRVKIIPDFSLRFVDEQYSEANEKIQRIQNVMVQWFAKRPTDLARRGISALSASFAAIYHIPFQSGMSLHFRFSGQSIPNRASVKDEKGVKIYFDPISTRNRQVQTEALMHKVFEESTAAKLAARMDPVETIVYHVAAHEVGHAIYNLEHVKHAIKAVETKSLLEEPRAELTSLHTMRLLLEHNVATEAEVQQYLSTFAFQDLRRFASFTASATRPYTISAINTFKTYERLGYITRKSEALVIDDSKALEVLAAFSAQFERLLGAEDELNGDAIEAIQAEMEKETPLIAWLVQKLHVTGEAEQH